MATKACLLILLACLTMPLRADRTFVWSGDDPRFQGWFSISDADYQARSFEAITHARFVFEDAGIPAASMILEDAAFLWGGNTVGRLTADGRGLSHEPLPQNTSVAFWVAAWQPPGIEVGMYGHNEGEPYELFTYVNYPVNFQAQSAGVWMLQVPEPSFSSFILAALAIGFASRLLKFSRALNR